MFLKFYIDILDVSDVLDVYRQLFVEVFKTSEVIFRVMPGVNAEDHQSDSRDLVVRRVKTFCGLQGQEASGANFITQFWP
jgi:hypothetical protein